MPYCPKCDMEFVEGIAACSDCGGPLVESEEAARALKKKEEEERMAAARLAYQAEISAEENRTALKAPPSSPRTYVKKSQKYDDLKSSSAAFLAVGGVILLFAALCWTGVVELPMHPVSRLLILCVFTAMGAGCLLVSLLNLRSAKNMASQIQQEEADTARIIDWFLSSYRAEEMDEKLNGDFDGLSPEELDLKRFELIQDLLVTNRDLPDQAYVDSLCEDIYARLYGRN